MVGKIFNKPKLQIYNEYPTINEHYPILSAKEYKRRWVKNCAVAHQKYKKVTQDKSNVITATKCPGIREIMTEGWIFTTWCDFTIETSEDTPYDYNIFYPQGFNKVLEKINYDKPIVSDFKMNVSPLKIPTGSNSKFILKIWLPWIIDIPKGWRLLILPVQYDDDPKFTACPGIMTGIMPECVIHLYWHETNGIVKIPAGTPLCQIMMVKDEEVDLEIKPMNTNITQRYLNYIFQKYHNFFK